MRDESRSVVWISHKAARCNSCGSDLGRGKLIVIDRALGIRCLKCARIGGLEFLPSGDVALTRRALTRSSRSAIVVKFSSARKRTERQGVLVEETAIEQAESENAEDEPRRKAQRHRRRVRDAAPERKYVAEFTAKVLALFPGAPPQAAELIAARACEKYSGRVGRSAQARALDEQAGHARRMGPRATRLHGVRPASGRGSGADRRESPCATGHRAAVGSMEGRPQRLRGRQGARHEVGGRLRRQQSLKPSSQS